MSSGINASSDTFEPLDSTWLLIMEHCPESEVEEVKAILGTSLVEQTIDLHDEVSTLLEIWRQIKDDADDIITNRENPLKPAHLPEPPHMRERLVKEIKFFVSHLCKSGDSDGGRTSARDRHLMEYVSVAEDGRGEGGGVGSSRKGSAGGGGGGRGRSRPPSAVSSKDGRDTPFRSSSGGPNSCTSLLSSEGGLEDRYSDHINATDIDEVVQNLRLLLEQDCAQCRVDLEFLQECIEKEQDFASSVEREEEKSVPTLAELRALGSQLEREYLKEDKIPSQLSVPLPIHHPHHHHHHHHHHQSALTNPLPPLAPKPNLGVRINRASKVHHKVAEGGQDSMCSPVPSTLKH